MSHRQALILFTRAGARAQEVLQDSGRDASRLDGLTWHGLRHTFASRLAMAGVDLRTIQELGGWKTLSMVQRYAHLAPGHLRAAVDRLVPVGGVGLGLNLDLARPAAPSRVSRNRAQVAEGSR